MNIRKCSNPMNIKGIEEWMTQFFVDPFTNLLDEETFRVDLFETSEEFIIEAELGDKIKKENISVTVNKEVITISILALQQNDEVTRNIILPINIEDKKITAIFNNGILETNISKNLTSNHKNKAITIYD
ncbi:HSP20 family molecular chaperone IbpA [Metabacillus crassostreae]|uniref:Hsp20/alpha crystallin family protein n=1 Tax=Metabacillus crassostreae TaxID=929098 RepID=UPI00195ABADF|nr:Hsp20 family protein [Metabacillus crassostreae]MBM7603106.1 HSP20 family molecular chaperone IbpA [Metabacillus crassostreae]